MTLLREIPFQLIYLKSFFPTVSVGLRCLVLDDRYFCHRIALTNCIDDILAAGYFTKDCVLAVKVWLRRVRDEELTAIGIRSCVGHRKYTGIVSQRVAFDFIFELVTGTAPARACGVASLNHEVADYPVKGYAVIEAFFGKEDEVIDCFRGILRVELYLNRTPVRLNRCLVSFFGIDLHCWRSAPLFLIHE